MRLNEDKSVNKKDRSDRKDKLKKRVGEILILRISGTELALLLKFQDHDPVDRKNDDKTDLKDLRSLKVRTSERKPTSCALFLLTEKSRYDDKSRTKAIGGDHDELILEKIDRHEIYNDAKDDAYYRKFKL